MALDSRSLLVLYATETGNSLEIAQEIGEAAERLRFRTQVKKMNGAGLKELVQYALVVFVTSTTGQGAFPANAGTFWKSLLRKKLPPGCLGSVRFTIFGLGDSSYLRFNWAARKLEKRLAQLGAVQFYPPGEGDERHDNGIDSVYLPWLRDLKARILEIHPLPGNLQPLPDNLLLPPKHPIRLVDMGSTANSSDDVWKLVHDKNAALSHVDNPRSAHYQYDEDIQRLSYPKTGIDTYAREGPQTSGGEWLKDVVSVDSLDKANIIKDQPHKYLLEPCPKEKTEVPDGLVGFLGGIIATLVDNIRVTPADHWQDVRRLVFSIEANEDNDLQLPDCLPGSVMTIFPRNFPDDVDTLIRLMGWEGIADKRCSFRGIDGKGTFDQPRNLSAHHPTTLRDLLVDNLDITAIPTRSLLKTLAHFAGDPREKDRLLELTNPDNTQEFYDYTSRPRRTTLEVLQDFPSVKIPLDYVLQLFPLIRGRDYSIARKEYETDSLINVELLVALVEYKTIIRKPRHGLCSRYIKSLPCGSDLNILIKEGRAQELPSSFEHRMRPVIAVATGTGIAPIRNLLNLRARYNYHGPSMLFFGCRNKSKDFFFQDEWPQMRNLQVIPAFSRDPIPTAEKETFDPYVAYRGLDQAKGPDPALKPMNSMTMPWFKSFDYDRGKIYVQHLIRKHAKEVCTVMLSGLPPIIIVCGNSGRMPISVRRAFVDALVLGGGFENSEKAEAWLDCQAYWQETW